MKDRIPDNVGSVVNHLQIRTDVQKVTALAVRLSHRWKAWEIDVVDVCNGDKILLSILHSSLHLIFGQSNWKFGIFLPGASNIYSWFPLQSLYADLYSHHPSLYGCIPDLSILIIDEIFVVSMPCQTNLFWSNDIRVW